MNFPANSHELAASATVEGSEEAGENVKSPESQEPDNGSWTEKEMEEAEPCPLPEVPDDSEESPNCEQGQNRPHLKVTIPEG